MDQDADDKGTGSHACQVKVNGDNLLPFLLRPEIPHISNRMNRVCPHPNLPLGTSLIGERKKGKFFRMNNLTS
jgi:hypothetical protein